MMGEISKGKNFLPEILLGLAALVLLGGVLGSHGIWTQEYRWQQVCLHMMSSKDYWHPYLDGKPYYDKPLLSYWFIIALAKINHGTLSNTVLRIPSVCAGFITLCSTYWLGKFYGDRKTAQRSAWLLLTTFYFVFWARVASADMLNVAAILLAVVWFLKIADERIFWRDFVFFLILVIGGLLKGLIAPTLVFVILIPQLWHSWKSFFNLRSMLAFLLAFALYLAPFMISSMTANHYTENGLLEVFRENILRFFVPFDHEGAWWTYLIYAPVYTLPWVLLLPAIHTKRTASCGTKSDNFLWATFSIFIFLSLSSSRRSYYILPIVPFVTLWIASAWQKKFNESITINRIFTWAIAIVYMVLCVNFLIIQPYYYLHHPG